MAEHGLKSPGSPSRAPSKTQERLQRYLSEPHQVKASILPHTTYRLNQQTFSEVSIFWNLHSNYNLGHTPHCCTPDCLWSVEPSAPWGKGPFLELSGTQQSAELRTGMFVNNEWKVIWLLDFIYYQATIPELQKFSSGGKRPDWWLDQSHAF